jgi:hypothetical protein
MKGRQPLAEGLARTERIQGRVRPSAAAKFRAAAQARGLTESDALREALAQWTAKNLNSTDRGSF